MCMLHLSRSTGMLCRIQPLDIIWSNASVGLGMNVECVKMGSTLDRWDMRNIDGKSNEIGRKSSYFCPVYICDLISACE